MNIKLTFHSNYNGWSSSLNSTRLLEDLADYSSTCYNEDGEYVEDIDLDQVKTIVSKYVKNAVVEVVEDSFSS
jgi:hypothetical protein